MEVTGSGQGILGARRPRYPSRRSTRTHAERHDTSAEAISNQAVQNRASVGDPHTMHTLGSPDPEGPHAARAQAPESIESAAEPARPEAGKVVHGWTSLVLHRASDQEWAARAKHRWADAAWVATMVRREGRQCRPLPLKISAGPPSDTIPEGPAYQWPRSGIRATPYIHTYSKSSYRRSARGTCTGSGASESWRGRPGSEARKSNGIKAGRVFSGRLTWNRGARHTGGASGPPGQQAAPEHTLDHGDPAAPPSRGGRYD